MLVALKAVKNRNAARLKCTDTVADFDSVADFNSVADFKHSGGFYLTLNSKIWVGGGRGSFQVWVGARGCVLWGCAPSEGLSE